MKLDRRNLLRVALGGGALAMFALPEKWVRPVVNAVIVPAHAATSPGTTTLAPTTTGTTTTPGPTTSTTTTTTTFGPTPTLPP